MTSPTEPQPTIALADAPISAAAVKRAFAESLSAAAPFEAPYRHWTPTGVFGPAVVAALSRLPFPAPDLHGVSGARELHNETRCYFDPDNIARHPVCAAIAEAFQSPETIDLVRQLTGASVDGCHLRIEYAQDTDGFWLQPHTDLGVKKLTMLYYLAEGTDQAALGTDIYEPGPEGPSWTKRTPFDADSALVFVPSDDTWHGFEPRRIEGVRKSVIINYVTDEWRAREQLAYPDTPVRA